MCVLVNVQLPFDHPAGIMDLVRVKYVTWLQTVGRGDSVGCCQGWKDCAGKLSYRCLWLSSVSSFSVRLLKGSNNCSLEESEDIKENSEDKENCSDSKKEVGDSLCIHIYLIFLCCV